LPDVITNSGGIIKETIVMGAPYQSFCHNTERPETITLETNELLGSNPKNIKPVLKKLLSGNRKKRRYS
jgi:UDP-N-acetylglucosamine 2-epimerase (non-hydrolysing)